MSSRPDDGHSSNHHGAASTEPGDPSNPNQDTRRELTLAPKNVKVERLPNPLTDGERPLTVGEAGETYLRFQRASWNSETRTSKYERQRHHDYPRILEADRHFQHTYESVTTVMLSRRLSPLDESNHWLTPWKCNEMLHGGNVHRSIREALDYQFSKFTYEWVAVTAPTRSAGTPHEHIYLWIDDPENTVTTDNVTPALEKHLKHCENAYQKHHRYRTDGTDGAITVSHKPPIVEEAPEKLSDILETSSPHPNTAGAQYLASQLAHLPLADYYAKDRETPPQALFEGAALAWASPHNWLRTSRGVPALS